MLALEGEELQTLRNFVARALPADWTDSGYLNWDTGMALERWHLGRYWGFAVQGLFAIVASPELRTTQEGRWAKWIFDRSLATYERLVTDRGPGNEIPSPAVRNQVELRARRGRVLTRFKSDAARAVSYGFADLPVAEPPPPWAYPPSIGRVAVTTPTYKTAIMAMNDGSFPTAGSSRAGCSTATSAPRVASAATAAAASASSARTRAGGTVLATEEPRTTSPTPPWRSRGRRGGRSGVVGATPRTVLGLLRRAHGAGHDAQLRHHRDHHSHVPQGEHRDDVAAHPDRRAAAAAEVRLPSYGGGGQIVAVLKKVRRQTLGGGARLPSAVSPTSSASAPASDRPATSSCPQRLQRSRRTPHPPGPEVQSRPGPRSSSGSPGPRAGPDCTCGRGSPPSRRSRKPRRWRSRSGSTQSTAYRALTRRRLA